MRHFLVLSGLIFATTRAFCTQAATPPPNASVEWLERASEQMNLRLPGAAPFHLKVTFHAFPGIEMLGPKENAQIITGDGTYEESWVSPHQWRREVTLADYHAIEVESQNGRKMQASSDYIPSRVLRLMWALFEPVPRQFFSQEFRTKDGAKLKEESMWDGSQLKMEQVTVGGHPFVRVSETKRDQSFAYADVFFFSPLGKLILADRWGIVNTWENETLFNGKSVPKHLSVKAGKRDLVAADVAIEPLPQTDPSAFDLPVGLAEPGLTLRPILYGFKSPVRLGSMPFWTPTHYFPVVVWGNVDRSGRYRELEFLDPPPESAKGYPIGEIRKVKWRPAELEGNPCEVVMFWEQPIRQSPNAGALQPPISMGP
jgi:hypothetical protein